MGVRKVFEPEVDGCSVILWEAGTGTRVVFYTEWQAENAAAWLVDRANQFHAAKDANAGEEDELMVTIVAYDEPVTEFQLVRRFIDRARRAGFEVQTGLERSQSEFW